MTRRPRTLIVCTLLLMAGPAWAGLTVRYQYDALGILPPGSSSARGRHLAEQHFAGGQLFSWSCLIESPNVAKDSSADGDYAGQISDILADVPGVVDVWSVAHPLGRSANDISALAAASVAGRSAASYYANADANCVRFEVMLDAPPLSRRAMASCAEALERVQQWADKNLGSGAVIHATGPTPYILNIKQIAAADQRRVMVLVAVAIGLIVLVWVRRPVLTLCMVGATLAVYAATLGAADVVFRHLFGTAGIDWKVQLFVFVVLVAVGQDYNIFVVSRIRQERRRRPPLEAVDEAVRRTGAVISSCGLIMAATLASLAATGMPLLQQLGFAFAFGVVLDTFVVRPLLLPALYLLCEGKGR